MHRFWDTIIEPALNDLQPEIIVEVGSDHGPNTLNLARFCQRHGAALHVIDPSPQYDVAEWERTYGEFVTFHLSPSLEALPRIERFDVVLLDGDHNWYTVYHELKLIEKRGIETSRPFPLVMLHDVGWPYGRRDGYYDPDAIPERYLNQYDRKGMLPGSSELQEVGGFNRGFRNAVREGGPRNGVLTAVEDFLAGTEYEVEFVQVPGLHGLGILVPAQIKERANAFLRTLELTPSMYQHLDNVERARIEAEIGRQEEGATLRRLEARCKRELENLRSKMRERNAALRQQNEELRRVLGKPEQPEEVRRLAAQLEQARTDLKETKDKLAFTKQRLVLWRKRAEKAEGEKRAKVIVAEISEEVARHTPDVSRRISAEDRMYAQTYEEYRERYAAEQYFDVGLSALRCIEAVMDAAGNNRARRILDLPCGHGRVLRFLRAAWPESEIVACDLLESGVDFCAKEFGAMPVYSDRDPAKIELPGRYDLIWCGSLLTHLPGHLWDGFLGLFASHLEPGGLLVFTTHGHQALEALRSGEMDYGSSPEKRRVVLSDYDAGGFGFFASAGRPDYGFAFSSPTWVRARLAEFPDLHIVAFNEHSWGSYSYQDVVGCVAEDL